MKRIKHTVFSVYRNNWTGIGEDCLMTTSEDYIGLNTGNFYSRKDHYSCPMVKAKIKATDDKNKTGMYHLSEQEENKVSYKRKYIGAIVTLKAAHWAGKHRIYYCMELKEFFSDDEIEILEGAMDRDEFCIARRTNPKTKLAYVQVLDKVSCTVHWLIGPRKISKKSDQIALYPAEISQLQNFRMAENIDERKLYELNEIIKS
jgi:hypothetical protein